MPKTHSHLQPDLTYARNTLAALVAYLRVQPAKDDALVIASIGDLQIRIDAADALAQRISGENAPAHAIIEARLAAAHAARLASTLHGELTGSDLPRQLSTEPETPLLTQRRQLGDYYLNGVAIA